MHTALTRLRASLGRSRRPSRGTRSGGSKELLDAAACSWEAMRATYEEQAARGVPEAVRGLELIEQGRWPTSGRPRDGAQSKDG